MVLYLAGFEKIPPRPTSLLARGRIVHLISFVSGEITKIKHLDTLKSLPSLLEYKLEIEVGEEAYKTVDIRTDCGYVLLCNENAAIERADYEHILKFQPFMIEVDKCEDVGCHWDGDDCSSMSAHPVSGSSSTVQHSYATASGVVDSSSIVHNKENEKENIAKKSILNIRTIWKHIGASLIKYLKKGVVLVGAAMLAASIAAVMFGLNYS